VVRSAFGDLVFPCRTECPDGPIRKLKNGVIIGAVSVPLAASRSQYRFSRDQDARIQSNGVSAAPCLPAEGQEPSASRNAGKAWSGKGVALLHSKSNRTEAHPRRNFLGAETVFRLASYCFCHWQTPSHRLSAVPSRCGRFFNPTAGRWAGSSLY